MPAVDLSSYKFPTTPFPHQSTALERGWKKRVFAYLMEQGTGKTLVALYNALLLYQSKAIDAVLIAAPKDVHEQWIKEQVAAHWPKDVKLRAVVWSQSAAQRRAAWDLIKKPITGHLPILSMNHEALATPEGYRLVKAFLAKYQRAMWIMDESHRFKTPKARRTRNARVLGLNAHVKRILTGTPSTQSPFDLYAQFRFLDERILGFDSFLAFKHHYGVFSTEYTQMVRQTPKGPKKVLLEYETLQMHQRLDELGARIAPVSFRVKKSDCLNLPPKMYQVIPCSMSKAQREIYAQIVEEGFALLKSKRTAQVDRLPDLPDELAQRIGQAKDRVSFKIKLTVMLRLQQLLGGFVTDDEGMVRPTDKICPRMQTTLDLCENAEGKVIVWAAYQAEIAQLTLLLNKMKKGSAAHYYGGTSKAERARANDNFRDRNHPLRILVANQKSGGTGRDWNMAETMIYYSQTYSVEQRIQSEDRAHRIGLRGTLTIYDLDTRGSNIDSEIRATHSSGIELAAKVLKATDEEFRAMVMPT